MNDPKARQSLHNLGQALERLREALDEPVTTSLVVDGTIQRFEFVIELYWKTLKRLLADEGIQTETPRESLRAAYAAGWISDEALWLEMLRDRNLTSHIYDEAAARRIYERVQANFPELLSTFVSLEERFGD